MNAHAIHVEGANWPHRAPHSRRDKACLWIVELHEATTKLFSALDKGGAFMEDRWLRPGGGGGVTRVIADGVTFEKVGVSRSMVDGTLSSAEALKLGGRASTDGEMSFFATGLSVVAHPRSPRIPTVHLNVRYFELTDAAGELRDAWFGGGSDLTPTYPSPDDARAFHRALRTICDAHHTTLYPRYKSWGDDYFRNTHRGNEARGVGGIFFDHLRPNEDVSGLDDDQLFSFASDIGRSLSGTYAPIVQLRRDLPTSERERTLQLARRARYAEFNLLHDRGTLFGLASGARVESVLMSLPPVAGWSYTSDGSSDSLSAALGAMLVPRDWAAEND